MKKLIIYTIIFISSILSCVHANELDFKPIGGGKFIYCNNPEGIGDDMLLNGTEPKWIMNNSDLSPNKYYIYLSHFNYTGNGNLGYDIELDLAMTAKEDSKLTVHKAFFETPYSYAFYKNRNKGIAETDWGMLKVCSDMLGIPLCDIRGEDFYYPQSFEPKTVEVKAGERIWLSEFMSYYRSVAMGKGVHIQALVEIESGSMDFNVGAIKSGIEWGNRENIPTDAAFGEYRYDYTLKGIAETLPEVETEIEYTIDESTADKENIPVFLKNQYIPEGHTVTEWYTQLNPQNDIWSKTTAAESDILPLYYEDNSKLSYYGENVTDKNNIWVFDTLHSSAKGYEPRYGEGDEKSFSPNFKLTTYRDNHTYACNIGNYGVATTYKMRVENKTNTPKYCSLVLTAAGTVIAYETNAEGEKTYGYVKDLTGEKVTDNMLSHLIPPNSTEEFKFTIILPVNYNGGIKNELVITNTNIQSVDFEKKHAEIETSRKETDYRSVNLLYGDPLREIIGNPPEIFYGNEYNYEYLRGKDTAIVRWFAWDGAPEWYYNHWNKASTVYTLDHNNNIIFSYEFPSQPCGASYNEGYFYVKTARDGVFKSLDGNAWEKTNEPLPEYIPYYDLEWASDWAIPELIEGWDLGLRLKWYGHSYNFSAGMSREGFCELSAKLLDKLSLANDVEGTAFSDSSNPQVLRLAAIGVVNGMGDGTFSPASQITREQAAVILARLTRYITQELNLETLNNSCIHHYNDDALISPWAKESVILMQNHGIMNGIGENLFEPMGSYSVEQSGVTILRLYKFLIGKANITRRQADITEKHHAYA